MNRAVVIVALVAAAALPVAGHADDPGAPPAVVAPVPPEQLPEAVHREAPHYPDPARKAGVTGTVVVRTLVGKDGLVKEARVVNSIPMLDSAAVEAVRHWTFKPALSGNKPVEMWIAVPVKFSINGRSSPMAGGAVKPPAPTPAPEGTARPPAPPTGHGMEPAPPAPPPIEDAPESDKPVEKLYVDAFNVRLAAAGDSAWAQAPATIAIEFAGGADCECARFTVDVGSPPERFDEADVTVTRDGFLDDSVRGDRYRLHMQRNADGIWNITRATIAWRCQKERGHEGYSPAPCR